MQTSPYGSWPSALTIDDVLAGGERRSELRCDQGTIYWLQQRPSEAGRVTVMCLRDGEPTDLTPELSVRSRVNEYGGGAYAVQGGRLVACDDVTGRVVVVSPDGVRPLTSPGQRRYGGLSLVPDADLVLAVCEDHSGGGEPETSIVSLSLAGGAETVLVEGNDFYAGPTALAGRLAWFEWAHPTMPWDAAQVYTAPLDDPTHRTHIAGGPGNSAQNPIWVAPGELAYTDDSSGFWAVHRTGSDATLASEHDHDMPTWVLTPPLLATLADGTIAATRIVDGWQRLVLWRPDGAVVEAAAQTSSVDSLAADGDRCVALVSWPDRGDSIIAVGLDGTVDELVAGQRPTAPPPAPESIWFEGDAGPTQAWWYPPTNPGFVAPDGELPPVVVNTHGGPTGVRFSGYSPTVAFYTSRGIGYLDVNYSGSAGFGRAYRDRLQGAWGVLDVRDCEAAVVHLADACLIDPDRVAIMGGSAGGYTTLQSLVSSDVFGAGISSYGIGDLEMLATDTHKFESRYLDGLVGPYPEARDRYRDLSPLHHVDRLSSPMLILQGRDDKVVPPNQAEAMADAVRAKGLPVALLMFDGEGHGWRRTETQRAALEATLSFLGQVFGFTPADDIPRLRVENLSE